MIPAATARLRFREMTAEDLPDMADLLGDPVVMRYYPAPKDREQAAAWIEWNRRNYREHGFGLWIVETLDGEFVGDCGLTWQRVDGGIELEVGYHVRAGLHGRGYATEAAAACRDLALAHRLAGRLVALVHPDNAASRRVAEKTGLRVIAEDRDGGGLVRTVLGMPLVGPGCRPRER
ncbi:GNAT family N-acetyltransferase [Rathayibacter sp. AY1A3]|uniref:GNAT family N-acetyltransferase n=1 Tax=Rathayibacter sp. AY1A3 TaxID=2080521 RepID=UPI000CE87F75|nr:GNAT family N-acetyltransferase [Rathayibacter sp. AY1A3]PPF38762.1 GNAT family N-acetyltransferase [Rathayibacter sp. AY1A3]